MRDLFKPIVPVNALHPAFEALHTSEPHAGARHLMNRIALQMGDVDGNFVREFQTQFHARLFELACFAYLETQGLTVERSHSRPDFLVSRDSVPVAAIEAVTANSPAGQRTDISIMELANQPFEEIINKCNEEFSIRIGSALSSKLKKKYWDLPHCVGLPFVLVVGPFHEPGSTTYIDQSLARYLYGVEASSEGTDTTSHQVPVLQHEFGGKVIPSKFFCYPSAENVSAIIYCNQFTVPRFFRIAAQVDGWPFELAGQREGYFFDPHNGPKEYLYDLSDPGKPNEPWWQGVTVFHNPNAIHPLPQRALRSTCEFHCRDVYVDCQVYGFHPLTSFMSLSVIH